MTTEQNVLDDLIQAIDDTNRSNDDFLKVLKEGRDQDVVLRDGTVVPSLTKRAVNAFSNSDYLMKADNLASVIDKQEARDNLNVPTKEDVLTATAQATDTVKGTAKIATSAIAQEGTNDTDIITAKKLRDALNASGVAPIFPSRAWGCVNTKNGTIYGHGNIQSFSVTSTGVATVVFKTPMPHSNYAVLLGDAQNPTVLARAVVKATAAEGLPDNKTTSEFTLATGTSSGYYGMDNVYFLVVC